MALTHTTAVRNALADDLLASIGNTGQLQLYTVGDVSIALLPLPATSGAVGATDLTFGVFTSDTDADGGECSYLVIETNGGTEIFRFLPGDITMSSTTIGAADTVSCSSLVWQPPA